MNTLPKLLITSCAMCIAMAANAAVAPNGDDTSRISNGGTGYIGLTQSAGLPRTNEMNPKAAAAPKHNRAAQKMGSYGTVSGPATHPMWGTPD